MFQGTLKDLKTKTLKDLKIIILVDIYIDSQVWPGQLLCDSLCILFGSLQLCKTDKKTGFGYKGSIIIYL